MKLKGDTVNTNPIPPHAVTMWEGDHDIFVALPMSKGGAPYITRFPKTEGGMRQALQCLHKRAEEKLQPAGINGTFHYEAPKEQPQVRVSKAQERLYAETTPEQRENARRLLAKLGIK